MAITPEVPRRDQLSQFIKDAGTLRRFERLFEAGTDILPADVTLLKRLAEENDIAVGLADAKAVEAFSKIAELLKYVESLDIDTGTALAKSNQSIALINSLFDLRQKVISITANYSVLIGNYSILSDSTAGNIVVTLPLASQAESLIIGVTKTDTTANTVTMQRSGTDLIVGEISQSLLVDGEVINVISDGTNWQLVN